METGNLKPITFNIDGVYLGAALNKPLLVIFKLLFVFSATAMSFMLSLRGDYRVCIASSVLAFLILLYLVFKRNMLSFFFKKTNLLVLMFAVVLASQYILPIAEGVIMRRPDGYMAFADVEFAKIMARIAFIAIVSFFYIFIDVFFNNAKLWFSASDRIERRFIAVSFLLLSSLIVFLYLSTDMFYLPEYGGNLIQYNVLFSNDTGDLISSDVYLDLNAPQNDLRHPLFAVFSLPFSVFAHFIEDCLLLDRSGYSIIMGIIQAFLFIVSMVSVARMLEAKKQTKLLFLVLTAVSYPFLLNTLNLEQYVFSVFWLIMFIYYYVFNLKGKRYLFIASTGSLLTSGIMFPLLTDKTEKFKSRIATVFKSALATFGFITVFGQLPVFFRFIEEVIWLVGFSRTEVTVATKVLQYFDFVASCFVAPAIGIDALSNPYISLVIKSTDGINLVGVALLAIVVMGFILNHKQSFARICFCWVLFSIALLVVGGWGVDSNDVILYVGYFSFAYLSLFYLFINKIFEKNLPVKTAVLSAVILLLAYINITGILDIISFGLEHYPV